MFEAEVEMEQAAPGCSGQQRGQMREPRILGLAILPMLLGLFFFAASLTPSLIPRGWVVQGALAGLVTAIGYMLGQLVLTAWRAIELPRLSGRAAWIAHAVVAMPVSGFWALALVRAAHWQDTVRMQVGLAPAGEVQTLRVLALAALVFGACFAIGWLVQVAFDLTRRRLYRIMPERTANVLGLALVATLLFGATRDGLVPWILDGLDESYETAQDLFATAPPAPGDPALPGGPGSLVDWGAMGQPGRDFVTDGPDAAAITALTGRPARHPIRVYVGRAQADDPAARAEAALEELKRLGAFDREVLIVASPTGTGWLDPAGFDPVEYLHDGNVASVAVQYSYLQSPLALIFETRTGLDQASATMRAVYRYWTSLPRDRRPKFYVHGISLGAWSSMHAFNLFEIVNDPVQGALWTGPPFSSDLWNRAVAARNPGSPYVLPEVGRGGLVRFMSQYDGLERATADWAGLRIVFMQYASDPIVFYEPASFWRAPVWMREPAAPDVSPEMKFLPIVTQFQLAMDMALSKAVPEGFGHNYLAADYIDAWIAVTDPEGWSRPEVARLKAWCGLEWGLGCRN